MKNKIDIRTLCILPMMAALLAIMAQIVIPIGPVPITLQTAGLMMAVLLFNKRDAFLSLLLYLLLGAIGLPVFSAGRGGLGMLIGPTGGFLLGFLAAAYVGAAYYRRHQGDSRNIIHAFIAVLLALVITYTWGSLHFMLVMHVGLAETLSLAVLPFLPFELLKIAVFVPVSWRVGHSLHQQFPATF